LVGEPSIVADASAASARSSPDAVAPIQAREACESTAETQLASVQFSMSETLLSSRKESTSINDLGMLVLRPGTAKSGPRAPSASIGASGDISMERPDTRASRTRISTANGTRATSSGGLSSDAGPGLHEGSFAAHCALPLIVLCENRSRQVGIACIDMQAMHTIELHTVYDNHSYTQTLSLLDVSPLWSTECPLHPGHIGDHDACPCPCPRTPICRCCAPLRSWCPRPRRSAC
jgi:hypothetical protein